MTPAAVKARGEQNLEALQKAQKAAGKSQQKWDATTFEFLRRHPEYGYRDLPSFDTGQSSIYMKVSPTRTTSSFWTASVEQECEAVLSILDQHFQAY